MCAVGAYGCDFRFYDCGVGGFVGAEGGGGIVGKDWDTQDVVLGRLATWFEFWHVGEVDGGGVAAGEEGWGGVEGAG